MPELLRTKHWSYWRQNNSVTLSVMQGAVKPTHLTSATRKCIPLFLHCNF